MRKKRAEGQGAATMIHKEHEEHEETQSNLVYFVSLVDNHRRMGVLAMGKSNRGQLMGNEHGQSMGMVALMLMVLFGFLAMAVDIGYAWGQRRFMQNAADAGALAAATLLASSAASDDGGIFFRTDDTAVRRQAITYAERNRVPDSNGQPADAVNTNVTMSYLDQNGSLLATSPTADNSVPRATARVRVQTRTTFGTFFARVIGVNSLPAATLATAAIVGMSPPTSMEHLWPYGVYEPRLDDVFDLWDSVLGFGNYKGALDYTYPCVTGPSWEGRCDGTGPTGPDGDWPGSHNAPADLPPWIVDGFDHPLSVGEKILAFGGNIGHNVGDAMNTYITNNCPRSADGTACEPDSGGVYAYAAIAVWDHPEKYDNSYHPVSSGPIDRVTLVGFKCVKVYYVTGSMSENQAYQPVSCAVDPGPGTDPPNDTANAVKLIE